MNYIDRVIDNLDNITLKNNKIAVIDPYVFEQAILDDSQNNKEYDEEQLELDKAIDFVMFCLNKEKHYKANKLQEFGCEYEYISEKLGFANRGSSHKSKVAYDKRRQEIANMMKEYIRVNNELADMKADYIKKGMKERSEKVSLKEICAEFGVEYDD